MNKAYKYRIYPNKEQEILMNKTFGCARFIWNAMLSERENLYALHKDDKETLYKLKYKTPAAFKKEFEWLKEVDSLALCNVELNLKAAYKNFFRDKNIGFPKYKSLRKSALKYTTNNQKGTIKVSEDGKHIKIPKMGDVRVKLHRQIPENHIIRSASISRSPSGKYHISVLTEYTQIPEAVKIKQNKVTGLDYSAKSLYVDSSGISADYPKYLRLLEEKLKKSQRKLSHREKGGENWKKQKLKVAKLHEKVSNQRKDFLHKESLKLVEKWDCVVIEDLNMKEMSKKLSLGKSTMDNGNGMFRNFLSYKLADKGKTLVKIDKWFPSSKQCAVCDTINETLILSDRTWTCKTCGITHDRDINAALNIKYEGIRMLEIG